MLNIKDEKGIALVLALIIMVILSILAVAMVFLGTSETKFLVKERLSDSALYIADGGVEYAISELQEDQSYRGPTAYSVANVGEFSVSVSTQGQSANHYVITSIGCVPDAANPRETRTVRSVVNIVPGTPTFAVGAKEGINAASNTTIKGDLRSDGQIVIGNNVFIEPSSAGASDGSIYTSTGMASGVDITGNLYMQPGREIKSRGPTNASMGGDTAATGIYDESKIKSGSPLIVENDTSSDTNPIGSYSSVDLVALDSMNKVVYNNFETITSATFDLNNQVHKFEQGVEFTSNVEFLGQGTIWVTGGSSTYGLEIQSNVYGAGGAGNYAKVNLIVSGGNWTGADIKLHSNVYINGLVSGTTEVNASSNVNIKGVIESGGTIDVSSNVTIEWSEFGFQIPITSATAATIVDSWQEL